MTNPLLANDGISVLIYEEGMKLPTSGTYFVVAGNGIFLHKEFPLVRCFTKVDKIGVLPDLEASMQIESKMPKVPAKHVVKIKEFFRRVVAKHGSEACTVLYYNAQTNDWKVYVSEQRASHGGVAYNRYSQTAKDDPEYAGYLCVGTIHSHCDFMAFHSGTDIHDEQDFDGIHGTFGHNERDEFTVSASVVINGIRIKVDPLTLFDGLAEVNAKDEIYKLAAPKEHREMMEQGVEDWVALVNPTKSRIADQTIWAGDQVIWKGEATQIRKEFGDGPFTIQKIEDDRLTLEGVNGWFSKALFKKV